MEPVALARLPGASVTSGCFSASVAAGRDRDVLGVSRLASQHQFELEDDSGDMVAWPRLGESASWDPSFD